MMIQTQRLEYPDHRDEIASLNRILAEIESGTRPLPDSLVKTVEYILGRLDHLMTAQGARLNLYDQREARV
jgi:hypothetical protein